MRYPDGGKEKRDKEDDERAEQDLLASLYRHRLLSKLLAGRQQAFAYLFPAWLG